MYHLDHYFSLSLYGFILSIAVLFLIVVVRVFGYFIRSRYSPAAFLGHHLFLDHATIVYDPDNALRTPPPRYEAPQGISGGTFEFFTLSRSEEIAEGNETVQTPELPPNVSMLRPLFSYVIA